MGLYVICNTDFLSKNSQMWKNIRKTAISVGAVNNELIVKCQMHGNEQLISCGTDFDNKCREGGCNVPCNVRLNCGHTCQKPCHVNDMEHKLQKCLKPCPQTCDTDYKHPCKKNCWQECGDCKVFVIKELLCGHEKKAFCYLDPAKIDCDMPCEKLLPCDHLCDKKCSAPCTTSCKVMVDKKIPRCQHSTKIQCSESPEYYNCIEMVEKTFPICKHVVTVICSTNVDTTPCPKKCETPLPGCEHLCKGTCGECRNGRLHIRCNEKCKRILFCGHECESKCSNICPPCEKARETACGHSQCGNTASKGEKSKKVRQTIGGGKKKSKNGGGRLCGEPCPPCTENCLNQCKHRQCELRCCQSCLVKPCNEPCTKLLSCSPTIIELDLDEDEEGEGKEKTEVEVHHQCIGICGEECLKICKICDYEKFKELQEIFFGFEETEDARFIQLKDCGHIFEVQGLDRWVISKLPDKDSGTIEIIEILCPECKTPIRKSKRYISLLNQRAADIEQIKYRLRGLTVKERQVEKAKFGKQVEKVFSISRVRNTANYEAKLKKDLLSMDEQKLTKNWFILGKNILEIVEKLLKYHKKASEYFSNAISKAFNSINVTSSASSSSNPKPNLVHFNAIKNKFKLSDNFLSYIEKEYGYLITRIKIDEISETLIQQLANETSRFGFLIEILIFMDKVSSMGTDFDFENAKELNKIFKSLFGSKEFNGDNEKNLWKKFKDVVNYHSTIGYNISEQERIEIVKALGSAVTKWYKCPNGHMYGIGDCGQASQMGKCPECKSAIGGQNHHLEAGNQDATTEMRRNMAPLNIPDPFVVRFGREW